MASPREILNHIKSIQDTQKITNAMYLISSTKMKQAKKRLEDTEPYFYTLQNVISQILRHLPDIEHVFIEKPDVKRTKIGLLVMSGDKGLAGAFNHNILKTAQQFINNTDNDVKLFVVGELGRQYFIKQNIPLEENFLYTAQNPTFNRARWIAEKLLEKYKSGEFDELHVIFTRMESSIVSVLEDHMILPLIRSADVDIPLDVRQEYFSLTPSPEEALDTIVPNYITGFIYGALVESFCSEQYARMTAMESATNNAEELLRDLRIQYNRARQAAITQEITEVCSGTKAQKKKKGNNSQVHYLNSSSFHLGSG